VKNAEKIGFFWEKGPEKSAALFAQKKFKKKIQNWFYMSTLDVMEEKCRRIHFFTHFFHTLHPA
jgi:hypothetical protein